MRISEVARRAGVGVETVRFYEQKGLVIQPKRPADGSYREYPPHAVRRIQFVRSAQALGFSLREIAELLALEAGDSAQCADVRRRAERKRREVLAKIEALQMIRSALDDLIEACPGRGPARSCSILDAIGSGRLCLNPDSEGET